MSLEKDFGDYVNPKKYVDVTSVQAYKDLPKEKRTIKHWYWPGPWYLQPMALPWDDSRLNKFLDETPEEGWDAFEKYIKAEYPIQHFIREGWTDNALYWFFYRNFRSAKDFYRKWVIRTFKPYNTKIRAQIPTRDWKDKEQIITDVLYACIIDFVENERNSTEMHEIDYSKPDEYGERAMLEKQNKDKEMILIIYSWAKSRRNHTLKQIEEALDEASERTGKLSYEDRYGDMNKLEEYLLKKDNEYLNWIINNRGILWT